MTESSVKTRSQRTIQRGIPFYCMLRILFSFVFLWFGLVWLYVRFGFDFSALTVELVTWFAKMFLTKNSLRFDYLSINWIVIGWKLAKNVRILPIDKQIGRRGAVVKGVEHISTNLLVNIWVARIRVPLVLWVGIWICKNSTINT